MKPEEPNIGAFLAKSGKLEAAMKAYQRALSLNKQLADQNPNVPDYRVTLATVHNNIGALYRTHDSPKEALKAHREAMEIEKKLSEDHPMVPAYQSDLAASYLNIGVVWSDLGNASKALAAYYEALSINKNLVRHNPNVTDYLDDLASCYHNIGITSIRGNSGQNAIEPLQSALKIREQLAREHPLVSDYQLSLAQTYSAIGGHCRSLGKLKEALASYQRSLEVSEKLARSDPSVAVDLGAHQNRLGILCKMMGKTTEAAAAFRQALKFRGQRLRENPDSTDSQIDFCGTSVNLAVVLYATRPDDALDLLGPAISDLGDVLKRLPEHAKAMEFLLNALRIRAYILNKTSRYADAVPDWRRSIELEKDMRKSTEPFIQLSIALAHCGQHGEATTIARRLLKTRLTPKSLRDLTRVFAVSANSAHNDLNINEQDRGKLSNRHARFAIAILNARARSGEFEGRKRQSLLRTDPDLNFLRCRTDFRSLAKSVGVELPAWALKPKTSREQPRSRKPIKAHKPASSR